MLSTCQYMSANFFLKLAYSFFLLYNCIKDYVLKIKLAKTNEKYMCLNIMLTFTFYD